MSLIERTQENAPPEVQAVSGVAMSLWMTGANETDVRLVARTVADRDNLRGAVDRADGLLTIMREAAGMDAVTCRKWIKRAVEHADSGGQ